MVEHLVFRRPEFVGGGPERPELGVFVQTHKTHPPKPSGRIAVGDRVWLKLTGGPVVARARVGSFDEFPASPVGVIREATKGHALYGLDSYWESRHPVVFGLVIRLRDQEWLDPYLYPPTGPRFDGWAFIEPGEASTWPTEPTVPSTASSRKERRNREPSRRRAPTPALRFNVLRRDSFRCVYCGRGHPDVELHVDHVEPFSRGGPTTHENLRTACRDCNLGKGSSPL